MKILLYKRIYTKCMFPKDRIYSLTWTTNHLCSYRYSISGPFILGDERYRSPTENTERQRLRFMYIL